MAVPSVFTNLKNTIPPLAPAPPPPPPMPALEDSQADAAQLRTVMQSAPRPSVFHPLVPNEQIEQHYRGKLDQDYAKDANPFGSANNHPGAWGEILHRLSALTGGPGRRAYEEQELENRVTGADTAESQDELRAAQQQEALQRGNAAQEEADAKMHPPEKPQKPAKWKTLFGGNGELVKAPNGQVLQQDDEGNLRAVPLPEGTTVAPKPVAGGHSAFDEWSANPEKYAEFQKAIGDIKAEVAAEHPQQAKNASFMNIYAAQRFLQMAYTHNPALLPVASKMIGSLLHLSPEETAQMGSVPEDQPLSTETGNPIGTSLPEAPTAGTRTQAQTAARVISEMPRIRTEVTNAASHLGPVAGREAMGFLLGTVGSTGNPALDRQLAELRGDLTFTGSAAAKFHLNSVRAMETYDRLIGEGKNTAAAIQGTLDSVESWAKTAQHQERGHESGKTGTAVGKTSKPDGVYEMNGKRYRVEGGNVYAQ